MGQKSNPNCVRLGFNKNWLSRWNAPDKKSAAQWILEDEKIRKYLNTECREGILAQIELDRFMNYTGTWMITITLHLVEVGLFDHEKERERLTRALKKLISGAWEVEIVFLELKNPGVSAIVLANEVVTMLEDRVPLRITLKRTIKTAMYAGAKGIRIQVSGRINGADMARSESATEGEIPCSTLRANIEYAYKVARTTYGVLGVKVWVNRGLYFGEYYAPMPEKVKVFRDETGRYVIAEST
ncbi:30S ribosomal protein S3 [Candidatus Mycoplasma haematominutum]|uniref:Small ribosomal subunit protein uS3 n=1 Tax=Candidatus Mycoplasma haematominutum 'Birmingham 1' TaxID=1116213 RepID=G8C321_9MOLU|nr:30S ribosomal protein S3 [Candidatus Mycoplasma haematominutum]CCE66719.1 ribosomal protein S3 [Candidatus Mycoplasma haematominutum 'Birmingham 1']